MVVVLITGMGSTNSVSVTKALRHQTELPVHIIGTDTNVRQAIAGSSFCDTYYTVPDATNSDYIPALFQICQTENVQVLFPVIDIEVEVIAAHASLFTAIGVYVWTASAETVRTCNNKYLAYRFLKEHAIPLPQTWLPQEIANHNTDLSYPLIVKPIDGRGSIGVSRIDHPLELQLALSKIEKPLIQQYLEGEEYTVDVLADQDVRVRAAVPRLRLEVKAGIAYKAVTVKNDAVIGCASRIVEKLQIRGPSNLQCRVVGGVPYFYDINPRFSGALPLTIAAGVNVPLLLVRLAIGQQLEQDYYDFQEKLYMARYWEEVFYQR